MYRLEDSRNNSNTEMMPLINLALSSVPAHIKGQEGLMDEIVTNLAATAFAILLIASSFFVVLSGIITAWSQHRHEPRRHEVLVLLSADIEKFLPRTDKKE